MRSRNSCVSSYTCQGRWPNLDLKINARISSFCVLEIFSVNYLCYIYIFIICKRIPIYSFSRYVVLFLFFFLYCYCLSLQGL
uniref:Putative ovule protein n=1 Tax=Solanum chacoense TaxID=4108 RepID=A0A0V0GVM2_SOLCH